VLAQKIRQHHCRLTSRKAINFFFQVEFFFLEARNLKVIGTGAALCNLYRVGQFGVLALQGLKVGRQVHGVPP